MMKEAEEVFAVKSQLRELEDLKQPEKEEESSHIIIKDERVSLELKKALRHILELRKGGNAVSGSLPVIFIPLQEPARVVALDLKSGAKIEIEIPALPELPSQHFAFLNLRESAILAGGQCKGGSNVDTFAELKLEATRMLPSMTAAKRRMGICAS